MNDLEENMNVDFAVFTIVCLPFKYAYPLMSRDNVKSLDNDGYNKAENVEKVRIFKFSWRKNTVEGFLGYGLKVNYV